MEKNYLFGFYINQKALIDNSIVLSTDAIFVLNTMLLSSESVEYRREAKEIDGEIRTCILGGYIQIPIAQSLWKMSVVQKFETASGKKVVGF